MSKGGFAALNLIEKTEFIYSTLDVGRSLVSFLVRPAVFPPEAVLVYNYLYGYLTVRFETNLKNAKHKLIYPQAFRLSSVFQLP